MPQIGQEASGDGALRLCERPKSMVRVGFLAWNTFQVAHFAEIARHFDEPDFIFVNRDLNGLSSFDPSWLIDIGAYTRFLPETELSRLDGEYDAILAQFGPPLSSPWEHTRLVIQQYSMAKPKTAYNMRWFAADLGLVYGPYSDAIIGSMCPTAQVGNPRFDPFFEGRLDPGILQRLRSRLDPSKKTVLFLPTWGDLSSASLFSSALPDLLQKYNVMVKLHHLEGLRGVAGKDVLGDGVVSLAGIERLLDIGPYLFEVSDAVVSDMSGAIFDAIYCGKPVVLLGGGESGYACHPKAHVTGLEIAGREDIGPYVTHPGDLPSAISELLSNRVPIYSARNENLVHRSFVQRGGCARLAADAVRALIAEEIRRPIQQNYAHLEVRDLLFQQAFNNAQRRAHKPSLGPVRRKLERRFTNPRLRRFIQAAAEPGRGAGVGRLVRKGKQMFRRSLTRLAKLMVFLAGPNAAKRVHRFVSTRVGSSHAAGFYKILASESAHAERQHIIALRKSGRFYEQGRVLERKARNRQFNGGKNLYQFLSVASEVRYSRHQWRSALSSLVEKHSGAGGNATMLRMLGFVETTARLGEKEDLVQVRTGNHILQGLGILVRALEIAAQNELVPPAQAVGLGGGAERIALADVPAERVVEFCLLGSFTMAPKNANEEQNRRIMMSFSHNCIEALISLGYVVYPRLQYGYRGSVPVTGRYPCLTWHTTSAGSLIQTHMKIGTLYGHIIIDSEGFSGWSSIANASLEKLIAAVDLSEAEAHWRTLYEFLVCNARSKYVQSEADVGLAGKYVFFPMQLVDDTVAKLAYIDQTQILQELGRWAAASDYKVVVKRHPLCDKPSVERAIRAEVGAGRAILTDAPIHKLLAGADAVVTVNSGTGAEALLHLKPVICAGRSDYMAACKQVRTVDELRVILENRSWHSATEDDIKRFLWFYTKQYMPYHEDKDAIRKTTNRIICSSVRAGGNDAA